MSILPIHKGTVELPVGNMLRHEAQMPMELWTKPIYKDYPGGVWKMCVVHGQPGWVWDVPDAEGLWVMRLEIESDRTMFLRQLSVKRSEVGFITEET